MESTNLTGKNTLKVTIQPHPFRSDKLQKLVDRESFRELFDNHVDTSLNISNAVILDGDERIREDKFDTLPKSDLVIIKMVPEGTPGQFAEQGREAKTLGGLLSVLSIPLFFIPVVGVALGAVVLGVGISSFLGGVYLYNFQLPKGPEQAAQAPSIQGSRNSLRANSGIPIVLGKHLVVPDHAALPYTEIGEDGDANGQSLHQLFCAGYEELTVDANTFKFGTSNFSVLTSNPPVVKRDGTQHTSPGYYPVRVKETRLGLELINPPRGDNYTTIIRTTPTNTKSISLTFSAPNGLATYDDKGNASNRTVQFQVLVRHHSDDPWTSVGPLSQYPAYEVADMSGNSKTPLRKVITFDLDNLLPSSPAYNATRQYDLRISRDSNSYTDSKIIDTLYIDNIKVRTGVFDNAGAVNTNPVTSETMDKLTTISIRVPASSSASGTIDQFNCVAQLNTHDYIGTGTGASQWTVGATSNPASMFLYVLKNDKINPHPVNDLQIDYPALEAWHNYCADSNHPYECNAVISSDMTVQNILNSICSTGKAAWNVVDGKYTVSIDDVVTDVTQMFTPRNSYNFQGSKVFADVPTALKMKFTDASLGYVPSERVVYADDVSPSLERTQSVSLFGVTSAEQAWRIGKYQLAVSTLRPETFAFDADIEHIVCTRGDRIVFTHDVPLLGLASGRIADVTIDGGNITGFISDETLLFESGKSYSVKIRSSLGTINTYSVNNPASETNTVTFTSPISGETALVDDDLFVFGETGQESLDLVVASVKPKSDLSATITCMPYSPEVFTAGTGAAPVYNPLISLSGDSGVGGLLDPVISPTDELVNILNQNAINSGNINRGGVSLVASRPDASLIGFRVTEPAQDRGAVSVTICDNNEAVVLRRSDSHLYRTRITDTFAPVQINTVVSAHPTTAGSSLAGVPRILYVNRDDNDRIYLKEINNLNAGTPVTTNAGYHPAYNGDDEFLYTDIRGFLHRGSVTDTLDGTVVTTFPVVDFCVKDSVNIYYSNPNDNNKIYLKSSTGDDAGTVAIDHVGYRVAYSNVDGGTLYYINFDQELDIYTKPSEDGTTGRGTPLFNTALDFAVNNTGDIAFISLEDAGLLYAGLKVKAIEEASLEATPQEYQFTGDLTLNSARVTNLVFGGNTSLNDIVVNDTVYNANIGSGSASIIFKGANYLVLDQPATVTTTGAEIQVSGSRIILDANRVIIPGTVTTSLLEANAITSDKIQAGAITSEKISSSAINSVQTTPSGPKTEIDLDSGTYKFRKANGDVIFDFDANRTNSELILRGDLDVTSDDESRHIQVGSQGLRAQDSGNRVIHDLPQSLSTSQLSYLGHTYWFSADSSFPDGVLRLFSGQSIFNTLDPFTWTTVNSVTAGNTNVRGVVIYVEYSLETTWSNYSLTSDMPEHLSRYLSFRPQGTNWGVFSSTGGYPVPTIQASGSGFWDKDATGVGQYSTIISARASQQMIIPTNSSGQFQFNAEFSEEVPPNIYYEQARVTIFQLGLIM